MRELSLLIDKDESDNKLVIVSRRNLHSMKNESSWPSRFSVLVHGCLRLTPTHSTHDLRNENDVSIFYRIVYLHYSWTEVCSLYLTSICLDNCKSSQKTRSLFINRTQIPCRLAKVIYV